ncbi:MAG: serine/threonine protein kinase [Labilithrix sp.]|nr:serine/threonine protein kinase [Labilithrix sp.]
MHHLGKYRLVAEIARGGMGIIYLAISEGLGGFSKFLIVKELKPEFVADPSFLQMFLEEARLAARLSHSNIIQTYEVGVEDDRHYIVMEYLDGVTLARVLRKKSPAFTLEMHVRVICEMLQGLHYAHTLKDFDGTSLGIVHRDVSPQNVFISFEGQAKIGDFGIAKARDSSVETHTGVLKGKPAYMAPEQVSGRADARADVYSAGVMLWEAVAGKRMWAGKGELEVLSGVISGDLPDLHEVAPDAPPELVATIARSLSKDPEDRHPSADALLVELETFLAPRNVTMRAVAEVLGPLFEEERAKKRAVVEAHVAAVRAERSGVPRLPDVPESTRTPAEGSHQATQVSPRVASTSPSPAPRDGRRRRAVMAILLLVALGTLATVAVWQRAVPVPGRLAKTTSAPPVLAPPPPPQTTEAPAPSKPAVSATTAPATSAFATMAVDAGVPPPVPNNDAARSGQGELEGRNPSNKNAYARRWTPPPVRSAPPPAPPHTAAAPSATSSEEKGVGYLTLDTYPWTRVSVGSRPLGETPLVRVQLPAGTHTLVMENAGEKIRQTTVVTIKSGETVSRRLAF